jgi:peptide/nickel transport system permease protein
MAADSTVIAEAPQHLTGRTVGQLVWRRFRRNKLARSAGIVIAVLLVMALLAPFLSTMDYSEQSSKHLFAPPQRIYFRDHDSGRLTRPYVYNLDKTRDRETLRILYT